MLPKLDGLEVCRRLRTTSAVPIIMLTARDDEVDKVLGLELGADDYITKPFSIREFRSRIRAMLRRATLLSERRPFGDERDQLVDGLVIDPGQAHGHRSTASRVQLTYVEFEVLRTLATHPGRVYSRQALLEAVWGGSAYREPRTIDVHIRHLREKLESDPAEPSFILTVRGAGYRFRDIASAPPRREVAAPAPDPGAGGRGRHRHGRGVPVRRADAPRQPDRRRGSTGWSRWRTPSRTRTRRCGARSPPQRTGVLPPSTHKHGACGSAGWPTPGSASSSVTRRARSGHRASAAWPASPATTRSCGARHEPGSPAATRGGDAGGGVHGAGRRRRRGGAQPAGRRRQRDRRPGRAADPDRGRAGAAGGDAGGLGGRARRHPPAVAARAGRAADLARRVRHVPSATSRPTSWASWRARST